MTNHSAYKLLRPLLMKLEPEAAHKLALELGRFAAIPGAAWVLKSLIFQQPQAQLACSVMGFKWKSPVCIAAGLDKDCQAVEALATTGVGAIELGTVTPEPQPGNPAPRMFRFFKQRSLVNRLGFPSCGVKIFKTRLSKISRSTRNNVVLGVNIGKNKDTPIESCETDYEKCATAVGELADYLTINVSSPNTPGLRALQTPEMLIRVIRAVQNGNKFAKPVAVKISPDCTVEQLNELVDCCMAEKISGIIATNTTTWRPQDFSSQESGGLSGALLRDRALLTVTAVSLRARGSNLCIIGAGGVSSAQHVTDLLTLGCSAVQLYSALVFEGPGLICRINRGIGNSNMSRHLARSESLTQTV